MTNSLRSFALVFLAACAGGAHTAAAPASAAFALPADASLMDGPSGRPTSTSVLLDRVAGADYVLLGEEHDNRLDHELRGRLIDALARVHPAIVFEQFRDSDLAIAPPAPHAPADSMVAWLDANGFDRKGWRWPLHEPVVTAAIEHARSLWGANVSRQALMPVVMSGGADSTIPAPLRALVTRAPLSAAQRAVMDSELVEGHCHQLPGEMIPGMRTAQVVRDAAMTRALLTAAAGGAGPAWLIAGNGHVRNDVAVPRLLRAAAPNARVLTVGFLERDSLGAAPAASERRQYDFVIVTPRVERPDPCAQFRRPARD